MLLTVDQKQGRLHNMREENKYEPPSGKDDGLDRGKAKYEASDPRTDSDFDYEIDNNYYDEGEDDGEFFDEDDEEEKDEDLDLKLLGLVIDFDVELTGQDDVRSLQVDALAGCTVEEARWMERL